jgi:hypothetical protein
MSCKLIFDLIKQYPNFLLLAMLKLGMKYGLEGQIKTQGHNDSMNNFKIMWV